MYDNKISVNVNFSKRIAVDFLADTTYLFLNEISTGATHSNANV